MNTDMIFKTVYQMGKLWLFSWVIARPSGDRYKDFSSIKLCSARWSWLSSGLSKLKMQEHSFRDLVPATSKSVNSYVVEMYFIDI